MRYACFRITAFEAISNQLFLGSPTAPLGLLRKHTQAACWDSIRVSASVFDPELCHSLCDPYLWSACAHMPWLVWAIHIVCCRSSMLDLAFDRCMTVMVSMDTLVSCLTTIDNNNDMHHPILLPSCGGHIRGYMYDGGIDCMRTVHSSVPAFSQPSHDNSIF